MSDNVIMIDNKALQQQNQGQAAVAAVAFVDNKSASRVALSSIYSPSPIPSTTQSVAYAVAKLKAAALSGAATTRRNIHMSIALDLSGSMQGERIDTAKESIKFIIEQLRPDDSLGLVTFNDSANIAMRMSKMSAEGKSVANRIVSTLRASGSTNLSGGLFLAHDLVCPGPSAPPHPYPSFGYGNATPFGNPYGQPVMGPNGAVLVTADHARRNPASCVPPPPMYPAPAYVHPSLASFYPATIPPAPTPAPAPAQIPVQISHEYNGDGNNPNEKCQYKLKIVAPEDTISKFTIHDLEGRFADILGSGETELSLKPLPAPIQQLTINFDLIGSNDAPYRVTYFLGETPSGKKNINIPAPISKSGGDNNNDNNHNNNTSNLTATGKIDDNTLRVVMLFTDGHANIGIKDTPSLVAQTQAALAAKPYDTTIFCFGFGANHNADMLQQVATASEGMFYFVESTKVMSEIFADCLGGLFSTVAQNVKVTARLTAGNGIRFGTPMTKFKTEVLDNGNTLVISMKDLYAEEDRDILLELKVDGPTAKSAAIDAAGVGIDWTLEYTDAVSVGGAASAGASANPNKVTLKNTCLFNISSDAPSVVNNEVDLQVQRFTSIQVMNQVREAADRGNLVEARKMAQDYTSVLRNAPSAAMSTNVMLQQQMMNLETLAMDQSAWASRGSKQSAAYAQSHAFQRGNAVSEDCAYAGNAKKMEMRSKAKAMPSNDSK